MPEAGRPIRVETDLSEGTARIVISRPPLNILDIATFEALHAALKVAVEREAAAVVVIQSAIPGVFSAGADVAEHLPEKAASMLEAFHRIARYLHDMEAVSVAAVNGTALGGGCELALCCDLVVAGDEADFGQPEIDVGCFPPIAAVLMPDQIGKARSADLILTGRRVAAHEAWQMGLVSRLVPCSEFDGHLDAILAELARKSPRVLGLTARALRDESRPFFGTRLERTEKAYLDKLLKLDDAREGAQAFLEKRPPRWGGR